MKKIIINESQFIRLLNEVKIDGYDWNTVAKYIKMGYLVHGTNAEFDTFDTSKIQGGSRAEYGYGMYFSNEPYKALEYGNEIYLTKQDIYNFLDLETMYEGIFNKFENIEREIANAKKGYYNARNYSEYEYYENLLNELESSIKLNPYEEVVMHDFKKLIKSGEYRNLEQVFKSVRGNLPSHFAKHISSLLLKCGYDGVKCGNQFVIFNFDLLNKNLVKEIVE